MFIATITSLVITINCYSPKKEQVILTNSETDIIPEGKAVDKKWNYIRNKYCEEKILAIRWERAVADFITSNQTGCKTLGSRLMSKNNGP